MKKKDELTQDMSTRHEHKARAGARQVEAFAPELLLVSAGFDAAEGDAQAFVSSEHTILLCALHLSRMITMHQGDGSAKVMTMTAQGLFARAG